MGFFGRIFSFGRKKKQKHSAPSPRRNFSAPSPKTQLTSANAELENEAEIGRLLRSSSARFHVVSEIDATSLPPLPHPINSIVPLSAPSSLSLASTTAHQRGTYSVTVHGRSKNAYDTDFHDTQPEEDGTMAHSESRRARNEKAQSQLLRLRADPSVASLLSMYDENGQLASDAFDNTPSKDGRAQIRRSGSTLRQLLGNPSSTSLKMSESGTTSEVESDISWAERFLSEHETGSAESSIQLRTPDTFNAGLPMDTSDEKTFRLEKDMSTVINPAEFGLNEDSIISAETSHSEAAVGQKSEPVVLRRASQVFAFIHERHRQKKAESDDKSMVDVNAIAPKVTQNQTSTLNRGSVRSRHGDSGNDSIMSTSSGEGSRPSTSFANVSTSTARRVTRYPPSLSKTAKAFPSNRISTSSDAGNISQDTAIFMAEAPRSAARDPPSRIPLAKGRRESPPEAGQKRRRVDTMGERSTSVPLEEEERYRSSLPRPRKHRRAASQGPTSSYETSDFREAKRARRSTGGSCVLDFNRVGDEENSTDFVQVDWNDSPVKFSKPASPVRAKSESRILSRLDNHRDFRSNERRLDSSSELSPVGKEMMSKARQGKRRTTDPYSRADRPDRGKFGFRG